MAVARDQTTSRPAVETRPDLRPRRHILDLDDFTRDEIEAVFSLTDTMKEVLTREIPRVPTLRGRSIVLLFYEASTRTRVSFEMAAKALSADTVSLQAQSSSVAKGESLFDTARTLQSLGADLVVMRHGQSGAPYLMARHVEMPVINAGDGWHAHPTQGLLDLFTVRERLGRLDGTRLVIVGDIMHSRVARSNIWGFTTMGAEVVVCGPPTLLPVGLTANGALPLAASSLSLREASLSVETDLDVALAGADVVMPLRLQRERQEAGLLPSIREYVQRYQVTAQRLRLAHPDALVMHPGPMNEGIEIAPEVAHGAQSLIEQQVANGVAVRMALLYMLLGGRRFDEVNRRFDEAGSRR